MTYFTKHDSLPKVLYLCLCWLLFAVAQIISGMPLFLLILLHSPFYLLWIFIGITLFQMKMIALVPVLKFWIFIWSDSSSAKKRIQKETQSVLNATYFNVASVNSLLLETFPQLLIQCINNSLVGTWSTIGKISVAISCKKIDIAICMRCLYSYLIF